MSDLAITALVLGALVGAVLSGVHIAVALGAASLLGVWLVTGSVAITIDALASTAFEGLRGYVFVAPVSERDHGVLANDDAVDHAVVHVRFAIVHAEDVLARFELDRWLVRGLGFDRRRLFGLLLFRRLRIFRSERERCRAYAEDDQRLLERPMKGRRLGSHDVFPG